MATHVGGLIDNQVLIVMLVLHCHHVYIAENISTGPWWFQSKTYLTTVLAYQIDPPRPVTTLTTQFNSIVGSSPAAFPNRPLELTAPRANIDANIDAQQS